MFNKRKITLKHIFPFIIILVLFSACDEEVKPLEFKIHNIDTAYEANITVAFDEAKKNKELSKTINKAIENAIVKTVNSSENATDLETVLTNFNNEYLKFKTEYPEVSEPIWELNIETELTYQSEDAITIAISTYEFKGGAHGNDQIKLLNLDAKTGKTLTINDLINDINGFKTLAESKFMESIQEDDTSTPVENIFFGEPFQLPENIGFSEEGLILIYNVYEVTSYDLGYTEFMIPFEKAESFLKLH